MSILARAHALQTELETLLGVDADSEIQGGIDEATNPPTVCVMLTEEAALLVVGVLRDRELERAAAEKWFKAKHKDIAGCDGCAADKGLAAALHVGKRIPA